MKILLLSGQTAGVIGLLTLLAKGHRPDVVAYSGDVELLAIANNLDMTTKVESWHMANGIGPMDDPDHTPSAISYTPSYDLLISVHGRQIVPDWFLKELPLGGINLHPCLSLGYRGARPIRRALADGVTKFSVAAHRMIEEVDAGEILVEKFIEIPLSAKEKSQISYEYALLSHAAGWNMPRYRTEADIYAHLYPLYAIVLSEVLEMVCR